VKFTINFSTDGEAFQNNLGAEVEFVLNQVQDQLFEFSPFDDRGFGRLRDSNGNRVGFWAHQKEMKA
jgi:hypothetical protein